MSSFVSIKRAFISNQMLIANAPI